MSRQFANSAALTIGSACYWTWCTMLTSKLLQPVTPIRVNPVWMGAIAFSVAILALLWRLFEKPTARRSLVVATIPLMAFASIVPPFVQSPADSGQALLISGVVAQCVGMAGLWQLWGFRFASIDAGRAALLVSTSILLTVAGFLLITSAPVFVGYVLASTLPILSAVLWLAADVEPIAAEPLQEEPSSRLAAKRSRFYTTRVSWGLAFGFVLALERQREASSPMGAETLARGLAVVLVLAIVGPAILRNRIQLQPHTLIMVPLVASTLMVVPFLDTGSGLIFLIAVGSAWLCWTLLSSVQLSSMKVTLRMSPVLLSFSEKATVSAATLLGAYLCSWTWRWIESQLSIHLTSGAAPVVLGYTLLFAATFSFGRHATKYALQTGVPAAYRDPEKPAESACGEISVRYGLTPRETEVLELLAAGHSRPYLQQRLMISKGTANAHTYHIYQKLGIHTQDELLELVGSLASRN